MKVLLLVFVALGFLAQVAPAIARGRRKCARNFPGHCKLHCGENERAVFMCDRYRQCCFKSTFGTMSAVSPHIFQHKSSDRKTASSHDRSQQTTATPATGRNATVRTVEK